MAIATGHPQLSVAGTGHSAYKKKGAVVYAAPFMIIKTGFSF
jgi:hypothetical protein